MKISTGLYPSVGRGEREGDRKVYFHDPGGDHIQAVHVLLAKGDPQIKKKGFTIVLYRDQAEYNIERDKAARAEYNIPEDAAAEEFSETTEYGAFLRTFTWYEVTA